MITKLSKVFVFLALANISCDPASVLNLAVEAEPAGLRVSRSKGSTSKISEAHDGLLIENAPSFRFRVSSLCQSHKVSDSCELVIFTIYIQWDHQFAFHFEQCTLTDRTGHQFLTNRATRRTSSNGPHYAPGINHELILGFGDLERIIRFPATLRFPQILSDGDSIQVPDVIIVSQHGSQ